MRSPIWLMSTVGLVAVVLLIVLVAAAIVLRFCFTDEITHLFEQAFPGYTIKWG